MSEGRTSGINHHEKLMITTRVLIFWRKSEVKKILTQKSWTTRLRFDCFQFSPAEASSDVISFVYEDKFIEKKKKTFVNNSMFALGDKRNQNCNSSALQSTHGICEEQATFSCQLTAALAIRFRSKQKLTTNIAIAAVAAATTTITTTTTTTTTTATAAAAAAAAAVAKSSL
ncbi:conserved hypothetical protein [Trichinella spiralis]|uniref:hypothetical protein n=1 Tax=Trichinella spiralis TaxID=6334 RepID=UPI0001EFE17B|nr:conserved hypothetical protein [Trichinella spiralis]